MHKYLMNFNQCNSIYLKYAWKMIRFDFKCKILISKMCPHIGCKKMGIIGVSIIRIGRDRGRSG